MSFYRMSRTFLTATKSYARWHRCELTAGRLDNNWSFRALVGNTPLVRLEQASKATGCNIWGKCEYANPGGSVKDRPALHIILDAEKRGLLAPLTEDDKVSLNSLSSFAEEFDWLKKNKKIIVEGSAGNTAIGLALAGRSRGYAVICVIPSTQTQEKKDTLRTSGALLVEVPGAKIWHPNHFVKLSGRLASSLGAFWANQFDNKVNRDSHYETTGPEIWDQLSGKVDGFVSAVGTGGTLAGVSAYLKDKDFSIKVALADVPGAVLHRYYTAGVIKAVGSSIVENIGQGRVTANLENFIPDYSYEISDEESLSWTFSLLKEEGLAVGMSSGVNVAGAVRMAKEMKPGSNIVTLLCDLGQRYSNKQYNAPFLRSLKLPIPEWIQDAPQRETCEPLKSAISSSVASKEEIDAAVEQFSTPSSDPASKI